MGEQFKRLDAHLRDVVNIYGALSVLSWDQETAMPAGGAGARARQMATLSRMAHEKLTGDETARLLEDAQREVAGADYDSDEASLVRVFQQDYAEATKLPSDFVGKRTQAIALAHEVWANARANKNFGQFRDTMQQIIEITQEEAQLIGYTEHPYDALLSKYERGISTKQVEVIFENHRPKLVDLISRVSAAPQVDDSFLHFNFPIEQQRAFALDVIKDYGFDFHRGMQAISVHPFCTSFSKNDVRLTTRFEENFLNPALFGMMHEAGHGMYEQGFADALDGTVLADGASLGVHESQSRMWENIVGRSKPFWSWALPKLKKTFPQLENVTLDQFYKGINKVERSFIRVEADEATYNLHIILRFELEKDILSGAIKVDDLPQAWNDKFHAFFGITPPDDALGVLQDVHWSAGLFGYFPTYALGNLLSVQYYNKALSENPQIPDEIAEGKFDTLLNWLNSNIHQHGRKFTSDELTRRITGESIQSDDYIAYLERKLSDVYGL